jgi:outer membrane protein assembly factor BamB
MKPVLTLLTVLLITSFGTLHAAELRFAGTLGNSDDSQTVFAGKVAAGIGPVLDDEGTLWERGGSTRLNRYALDGRLLASFEIPEGEERGNDQLTLAGDLLVLKLRKTLYTLPVKATRGTKPTQLQGEVDVLASGAIAGRIVGMEKDSIFSLDPATGERTAMLQPGVWIQWLHVDTNGTLFGFGEGKVYAWQGSSLKDGFPKGFQGERPQKIGRHWYSHAWHGTINRFNESFDPDPGVVLGGASGSFIGYLPQSNDLDNGRGMVKLRDGLFAVSGIGSVIQFVQWNDKENRFDIVRRIGGLMGLSGLALDNNGNIWASLGSWRWQDEPHTPLAVGDPAPQFCAQPVMLGGKTLCVLKKHFSYVQLVRGPVLDENGRCHQEVSGIDDFTLPEDVSGAAWMDNTMIVTRPNGEAYEIPVNEAGQLMGPPKSITLPGLKACTSLAWFENQLLAADADAIVVFDRGWKDVKRSTKHGGAVYVHSDGKKLVVSDPKAGAVLVYDSLKTAPVSYTGLKSPAHVAIEGSRVIVNEMGKQRLVKLELVATPATPQTIIRRLGGIPMEIEVTETAVSVKTPAEKVQIGVFNGKETVTAKAARVSLPKGGSKKLHIAVALEHNGQRERFGFIDHHPIHAPFNDDPASWAEFDLESYRELESARQQEIRLSFEQPQEGKATVVIENEKGQRIRNIVSGRAFNTGKHEVVWDGLDEDGKVVAPGNYSWRAVTHEGIRPRYLMNFGNGDEATTESWGPNHSTLHSAAANDELVFFAAPVTEGGWALMALNNEGKFVQGYEHQHGFGIEHDAITADSKYLYCAQDGFAWGGRPDVTKPDWKATWTVTVCRYDIATGKLVEWPGNVRGLPVDTMDVSTQSNLKQFNLGGMAVMDGRLYVGSRDKKCVFVLDATSGQQLEKIPLPGVRHLSAGKELFAATDAGVVRVSDQKLIIQHGDISGLTVAPNGDFLICDAAAHQVRRFSTDGKELAVIGKAGGKYSGAYDPQRMVNPAGLAFGPDGKLWVTEKRWNPKRVFAWDLGKNEVVIEKFGMPHYGGDGSGFDSENPRRWIGLGCFWDVDIENKTARPTHVMSHDEGHLGHYEPHSYSWFREDGRTFVSSRGKIALISEVLPDGTVKDIAATANTHLFSYAFNWHPPQAYIDAFYAKWPDKRAGEKPDQAGDRQPWSQRGMGVLWVDRNGDGEIQQAEFDFCGDQIAYGDGAWGHMHHSLTFYIPVADNTQVKVAAIKPKGILANGVPDYPTLDEAIATATTVSLAPGYKRSGVATVRDRQGRFLFNSDPEMNAYAADGRHLWRYPNQWSDVHGSHDAPLPEPGVMQGVMGFLGIAPLDDTSDVVFVNGNHGRCFVLSTDGFYLDEAFVDVRVSYLKNEYRLGGEIFGGSFGRDTTSGRYFVQIGHGPYRIYELEGFNTLKRHSGRLKVTAAQIAAAERQSLRVAVSKQTSREATLPGTITWDKSGKFKAEVDLGADITHLHLTWKVQDASPWINNGRDWTKLFATGDTVDFQFACDPKADPKRREPVLGDKRLLIAPHEGKAIAVLYEHRKAGGKNPIEFTSPWRGAKVDDVRQLTDATIHVKTEGNGYTVTAALPLADLGLTLTPGQKIRADLGVTFGDASGTDTNLRSYWSNQSTGLVDDIPGEIMLTPSLWGELEVK